VDSNHGEDPYLILGLTPAATAAEIRRAYRRLCLVHHPDRNAGSEASVVQFQKIAHAYRTLSSPKKKRAVDSIFSVRMPPKPPLPGKVSRSATRSVEPKREGINILEPADALRSALLTAALFPVFFYSTSFAPHDGQLWEVVLLAVFSGLCCLFGAVLGRRVSAQWEATEFVSVLFSASFPALFLGLLSERWSGCAGFPFVASILSAGLSGCVAASVGRAVGHSPTENAHPLLAVVVASLLACVLAALSSILMTSATSDVFGGLKFFSLLGCSAGASVVGASLAAARGALQPLRVAA
jgi:curved DNA-binding protein CbpA